MNFNHPPCKAGMARAARLCCPRSIFILSGLLVLTFAGQVGAQTMLRPAFQGAAAPQQPGAGFTAGFDINLVYINAPTPGEAAAFASAEATWENIITGYQIDDIFNTTVTINVFLNPIDGPGGILGSAGPTHAKLNAAQTAVTSTFGTSFPRSTIAFSGHPWTRLVRARLRHTWMSSLRIREVGGVSLACRSGWKV